MRLNIATCESVIDIKEFTHWTLNIRDRDMD